MRISDWSSDVCSSDLGFDLSLSETVRDDLHQRAKRIWPGVGALPVIGHWAGLRPYANRDAPLLEAVEGQSGLYVATGHYRLGIRSEEHTSELQSLMRISKAVFCFKTKTTT